MIDFLKRLFGQTGSSTTAKERLRLVLMTDHLELAPEMIEAMKHDLVDVISRYVEVDREKIEVTFEQQDKTLAMPANIPILAVNRNGQAAGANGVALNGGAATAASISDAPAKAEAPVETRLGSTPAIPKRRRRRRKKAKSVPVLSS